MFVENGRYNARELLNIPLEQYLQPGADTPGWFEVVCDDGSIFTDAREMIYTRHLWELYQYFPNITIKMSHHFASMEGVFEPNTPDVLLNRILWDCIDVCNSAGVSVDKPFLCDRIYRIAGMLFRFYQNIPEQVVSINILDYIDVMDQPPIHNAMIDLRQKDQPKSTDISKVYSTIKRTIETSEEIADNALVLAFHSKSIKAEQLYKCIGPNGFITDVDSHIFRYPVLDSFVSRLTQIEDILMESRTAAMSIFYQSRAMQDSEYLTRQLQLIAECVWRIHHTDCGSKRYLELPVPDGKNLNDLKGVYYLDPADGVEKLIPINDRNLRGTIIKIRSPLTCQIPDRYGVCARCYGQLAESLMPGDNIGHIAATILQKKQTQRILSNKHLVGSASVEHYRITGQDTNYLVNAKEGSAFYVNPALKDYERVCIVFEEKDAQKIQEIEHLSDLRATSPGRLSSLNAVAFYIFRGDTLINNYIVKTSDESRKAYFTVEFLEYLRKYRWKHNVGGEYVVDLTHWDYRKPIMDMPQVQYSTPAHMMAVKTYFTSGRTAGKNTIAMASSPTAALIELYTLVRAHLDVHITHLQILVLAMMVADPKNNDYRIPVLKHTGTLASYNDIMARRDSALAMAYEDHFSGFFSKVDTYIIEHRHPHPFTRLLAG